MTGDFLERQPRADAVDRSADTTLGEETYLNMKEEDCGHYGTGGAFSHTSEEMMLNETKVLFPLA